MSDHKPFAEQINAEVDAFFRLWHNRRWLAVIVILAGVSACAFLIMGWIQRGNAIEDLRTEKQALTSENKELKRDIRQIESENKSLRETVAPLIAQATREFPGEEISEALKRIVARLESIDPLQQPIASASASVTVVVDSDDDFDIHYMDHGGYLAFGRGTDILLLTSADESYARQTGEGEVVYSSIFQMPATDSAVGKPINFLQQAEYLQISFLEIPNESSVLSGEAIIVVNGSQRFEFQIPPQTLQGDKLFVRGIGGFMNTEDASIQP